ncbi:MAG: arsenate reductase ArsC [Thermodesulfobacteriota bacterium]|nr:arsenate reductase ArsC [Thermodesulfobacteriota bacterium]
MKKVLFICVHNSARSQMAEAFLQKYGGGRYEAESAGFEPRGLNPLAVEVMRESGIDISRKTSQSVFDLFKNGLLYSYVITVCDGATEKQCPVFPGVVRRLHWEFPDPAVLTGSYEERLAGTRDIRDLIEAKIKTWLAKMPDKQ